MSNTIGLAIAFALGGVLLPGAQNGDCNGNGVGDAAEIAAASYKDSNHNGVLDLCEGLSVDRDWISLAKGGTQELSLDLGPGMAGSFYWMLGSLAGDAPGMPFGFAKLPLNFDGAGGYMLHTMKMVNVGFLKNGVSALDAQGRALARFVLPAGFDPALAGLRVHHAFLIVASDLKTFLWGSNSVSVLLVP